METKNWVAMVGEKYWNGKGFTTNPVYLTEADAIRSARALNLIAIDPKGGSHRPQNPAHPIAGACPCHPFKN